MPTRNPLKQFFVTFPQWTDNNSSIKSFFLTDEPLYLMIAREHHQDGGIHFHVAVKYSKGTTKTQLLKLLSSYFPNDWKRIDVQSLKSWRDTFIYLTKEDAEPYEYGERPKVCNNLPKKVAYYSKDIAFLAESKRIYDMLYNDYKQLNNEYSEETLCKLQNDCTDAMLAQDEDAEENAKYVLSSYVDKHQYAKFFVDRVNLEDFRAFAFKNSLINQHTASLRGF